MGGGGEIVDLKQWERGLPQEPEEGSEKDEEFVPGDEQQFAIGQGVDEALHLMAEGGTLPPDPAMQGRVPESADSFRARMRQLTTRYESQFLRRKDWEITSEEIREMDRQWQETPWDAKIPLDYEDITEPIPAPDWPPEIERQYRAFEWILYRLRRAHVDEDRPDRPARDLASAGLVSKDVLFSDGLVCFNDSSSWVNYGETLRRAGAKHSVEHMWGSVDNWDDPHWTVVVDSELKIPYPPWYPEFFRLHLESTQPFDDFGADDKAADAKRAVAYIPNLMQSVEASRKPREDEPTPEINFTLPNDGTIPVKDSSEPDSADEPTSSPEDDSAADDSADDDSPANSDDAADSDSADRPESAPPNDSDRLTGVQEDELILAFPTSTAEYSDDSERYVEDVEQMQYRHVQGMPEYDRRYIPSAIPPLAQGCLYRMAAIDKGTKAKAHTMLGIVLGKLVPQRDMKAVSMSSEGAIIEPWSLPVYDPGATPKLAEKLLETLRSSTEGAVGTHSNPPEDLTATHGTLLWSLRCMLDRPVMRKRSLQRLTPEGYFTTSLPRVSAAPQSNDSAPASRSATSSEPSLHSVPAGSSTAGESAGGTEAVRHRKWRRRRSYGGSTLQMLIEATLDPALKSTAVFTQLSDRRVSIQQPPGLSVWSEVVPLSKSSWKSDTSQISGRLAVLRRPADVALPQEAADSSASRSATEAESLPAHAAPDVRLVQAHDIIDVSSEVQYTPAYQRASSIPYASPQAAAQPASISLGPGKPVRALQSANLRIIGYVHDAKHPRRYNVCNVHCTASRFDPSTAGITLKPPGQTFPFLEEEKEDENDSSSDDDDDSEDESSGIEAEHEAELPARQGLMDDLPYMKLVLNTIYHIDKEAGKVNNVVCQWEQFDAHVLGGTQDAMDLYLLMTRLHMRFNGQPLARLPEPSDFEGTEYSV